ncbi:hypothetical protein NHX12_011857 [Muraenolepis orangiensis]|uniref:Uncharacterized protein n=1 Tax=Muraenolepis orangiensis TaxID=630683 RepID=A0A9Q0DH03_9TELE|nr:hypothetical protein NHX12_011857 [Muraenolepis orangiensis]
MEETTEETEIEKEDEDEVDLLGMLAKLAQMQITEEKNMRLTVPGSSLAAGHVVPVAPPPLTGHAPFYIADSGKLTRECPKLDI